MFSYDNISSFIEIHTILYAYFKLFLEEEENNIVFEPICRRPLLRKVRITDQRFLDALKRKFKIQTLECKICIIQKKGINVY